ncbi:MAG: SDR family oxidoreductase [Gammaproteobacteria bacterium]|jgi:NAD(P)-dependent dehydrogenase (short-subunit alcohol dehydrogenase family)|nr:SDR family oxidoreductase [Gammaproteobacteria bacterium]
MKKQCIALFTMLSIAMFSTAFAGGHNAEKLLMEVEIPETVIELPEGYVPTVMITGANRGIGFEFVKVYLARGYNVIATARSPGKADELNALAAENDNLTVVQLDVTDFARVDELAADLQGQPIDILINNAGISGDVRGQMFGNVNYDEFRKVLDVNVVAPTKIAEAFYQNILDSQLKKLVVVSSSEGSIAGISSPRTMVYRTSKAAVNMMYTNLAVQLKRKGITVAMVNPGLTDTDFVAGLPKKMLRPADVAAEDMARNIDNTWVENTGTFWNYDGRALPW